MNSSKTVKHSIPEIWKRIYRNIFRVRYALLILLIYFTLTQSIFHTVCPFAILTGKACPACGLTRSAFLLLSGHFIAAAQLNATIYLWLPFLLYLLFFRYILCRRPSLAMPFSIIICLITFALYIQRLILDTLPVVSGQNITTLFFHL
ncbi:MAG: DUF2752 domain-containing protein [Lachnospiraceae bacterium]|nr:DUF2752 domain-containing protein [Lachnospiraceae bacterium]